MALSTEQAADLLQFQTLSTHIVTILDKEASIDSVDRQLTSANITALNDLYTDVVTAINQIVETQITPP